MYNRVHNFFKKITMHYDYHNSTFHALISLTEDIRKNIDKEYISSGIFADLRKAFDIAEHDTLLAKT